MMTMTNLDFEATGRRARYMSDAALLRSANDAAEAAEMARAGCPVSKTSGYYRDEASVYRAELRRREAKR